MEQFSRKKSLWVNGLALLKIEKELWRIFLGLRERVTPSHSASGGNDKSQLQIYSESGPLCKEFSVRRVHEAGFTVDMKVASMLVDGRWNWPINWERNRRMVNGEERDERAVTECICEAVRMRLMGLKVKKTMNVIKEYKKRDNVVKSYVTWVDEEKKTLNMITESFTLGSLREFRMKHKSIDLKAVKNWARQILGGLVYLHSQQPPIIHGDLSCDNIFFNGCRGEVKIGDTGLASFTRSRALDFMAPEFFEEKYDELVDTYSFGMCILEVVTCEHPYSECKGDQSEIHEKVTSGVKPLCLSKVRDLQVKEFKEKCLVPAAQRLSAKELLKDPYLAEGCINKEVLEPRLEDFFGDMQLSDDNMVSLGSSCVKKDDGGPSCVLSEELPCVDEKKDLDVKKEKNEEKFVTIKLRVVDVDGNGHNIEFPFNLDAEDPHETAKDMIEEVGIIHEDVDTLADRIKDEILKLVPTWRPSLVNLVTRVIRRRAHQECHFPVVLASQVVAPVGLNIL
uniref:probable serine/threonine-protein kinase WNK4 n=1 Tax=Erigeron canadensis TaxID=72917 RepID=UPI001CB89F80|nr:probable serine/threonine-protein kinase WNK4 [Erigeron canadensis]